MAPMDQPVTILISALGGEGGGVLADWLVDTARHAGHPVSGTSIPGVAQRTGATTYYVEVFPRPERELGGRRPVLGLFAVPGQLDLLVGSELLEAARQAAAGLVSPDRTAVLVSDDRTLTTVEKMGLGDGRVADAALHALLRGSAAELELLDMAALAHRHGTVVSAVMFGALAGWACASGRLPFARADYEATIRRGGKGVEASLRGFGAAFERVQTALARRRAALALAEEVLEQAAAAAPADASSADTALADLPPAVAEVAALGRARLRDYQDAAYADAYVQRLRALVALERAAGADPACPASAEAARWLALWWAFDDVLRVADLKSRAGRWRRVQREVGLADGELLRVWDHFKPGVPELAGLLPPRWAAALQRWDARRVARGQAPWALPLRVASHSVAGLLALRALAALRRWRRAGARYAEEHALAARWLDAVERGLAEHPALGLELARCGRLVKGYGSTRERGQRHLMHLVEHLAFHAPAGDAPQRAAAVAAARQAALADDAGRQLDRTLQAHGAPPRPLAAQPIRWHPRRPAAAGPARPR